FTSPRRQPHAGTRHLSMEIRCMYRTLSTFGIILATPVFVACSDSVAPKANATLTMQDQCDPASFNAALGAGTCTKQGIVTFSQFNAELNATHRVPAGSSCRQI